MARRARKINWFGSILTGLLTGVALIVLVLAAALIVVPKATGGMSLTVLTGSMRPGIQPGDVVVVKGVDAASIQSLQVGDVITFLPFPDDPTLVTHRIVAKIAGHDGYSFITQGDANNAVDTWGPVYDYQIRGQLLFTVPKVGYAQQWIGSAKVWLPPAIGLGLIGYGVIAVLSNLRRRRPDAEPAAPAGRSGPSRALVE